MKIDVLMIWRFVTIGVYCGSFPTHFRDVLDARFGDVLDEDIRIICSVLCASARHAVPANRGRNVAVCTRNETLSASCETLACIPVLTMVLYLKGPYTLSGGPARANGDVP